MEMKKGTAKKKEFIPPDGVDKAVWEENKEFVFKLVSSIAKQVDLQLVEITDVRNFDDILIDAVVWNKDGVDISHLVKMSKMFMKQIETKTELKKTGISEILRLDLSSPGIDRTLKDMDELNIFCDQKIIVSLDEKEITGINLGIANKILKLETNEKIVEINIDKISKIKLAG